MIVLLEEGAFRLDLRRVMCKIINDYGESNQPGFTINGLCSNPMTCGDIFRVIIAFFIPPLGVFTQVGFTQPFWINLVIYLFAVGGLGFPVLFGMWPAAVIHALFVILTRK